MTVWPEQNLRQKSTRRQPHASVLILIGWYLRLYNRGGGGKHDCRTRLARPRPTVERPPPPPPLNQVPSSTLLEK